MDTLKLAENVHWVGVHDKDLAVFDITMPTKHGTTYNSYIIQGSDAVAVVDGVKEGFTAEWFKKIEQLVPVEKIDYLIVNHNEPDHSGSIPALLDRNPDVKLVCGAAAMPYLRNIINREADITGVKNGHELSLGDKTFVFTLMPYMHWPDTMMDYLVEDRILFSNDGFAAHLSSKDSMWADEVSEDVAYEVKYYFDSIMRPFTGFIRKNIPKLDGFELDMLAPSHGPIFRKEPRKWIEAYADWSRDKVEEKDQVTIFYASNYGNTKKMAEAIGQQLNDAGMNIVYSDVSTIDADKIREEIEASKAVLVGTPTFNGDAVKPIWDLCALFSTVYSIGKKAAVFGSVGWAGEGPAMITDRLRGLKLKVYEEPYKARLVPSGDEMTGLTEFSSKVAEFIHSGK